MINLLPVEKITAVRSEYKRRRLTVLGAMVLAWFLMVVLLLSVLYFLAYSERLLVSDQLAMKQKTLADDTNEELDRQLTKLADEIKIIKTAEAARILPFDFLQHILAIKPAGVKINSLFFFVDSGATISLSGVADSRRNLLAFLDELRGDQTFSSVDSPVSNLIKESNVNFTFKLHLNNRHE